jgi:hypothetical protein
LLPVSISIVVYRPIIFALITLSHSLFMQKILFAFLRQFISPAPLFWRPSILGAGPHQSRYGLVARV